MFFINVRFQKLGRPRSLEPIKMVSGRRKSAPLHCLVGINLSDYRKLALIDSCMHWLMHSLIDSLIDWFIHPSIHPSIHQSFRCCRSCLLTKHVLAHFADDAGSHGSHASQDAPAPENPEVQKSISALLTPYLATKLNRGEDSHQVRIGELVAMPARALKIKP